MFFTIIVLLALGILLLFLELFVPGGLLGALGVLLMAAGVYLCFQEYGSAHGWVTLVSCFAISVGFLAISFRLLPHSPMGKHLFLSESETKQDGYVSENLTMADWTGKEGVAESDLRPAGIALLGNQRLDVMADGDFIEAGSRIQVAKVDSNRIIVRQI